jgi:hypothetical protein
MKRGIVTAILVLSFSSLGQAAEYGIESPKTALGASDNLHVVKVGRNDTSTNEKVVQAIAVPASSPSGVTYLSPMEISAVGLEVQDRATLLAATSGGRSTVSSPDFSQPQMQITTCSAAPMTCTVIWDNQNYPLAPTNAYACQGSQCRLNYIATQSTTGTNNPTSGGWSAPATTTNDDCTTTSTTVMGGNTKWARLEYWEESTLSMAMCVGPVFARWARTAGDTVYGCRATGTFPTTCSTVSYARDGKVRELRREVWNGTRSVEVPVPPGAE